MMLQKKTQDKINKMYQYRRLAVYPYLLSKRDPNMNANYDKLDDHSKDYWLVTFAIASANTREEVVPQNNFAKAFEAWNSRNNSTMHDNDDDTAADTGKNAKKRPLVITTSKASRPQKFTAGSNATNALMSDDDEIDGGKPRHDKSNANRSKKSFSKSDHQISKTTNQQDKHGDTKPNNNSQSVPKNDQNTPQ